MKLSIKGLAISTSIGWAVFVSWCILMKLFGIGSTPFDFVDQFYFGWLSASFWGLIYGTVFALIDGLIVGTFIAILYNHFALE